MDAQAKRVAERLASRKIHLELEEDAVQFLADRGYDPAFGARPVKRVVQQLLETALAKVTTHTFQTHALSDPNSTLLTESGRALVTSKRAHVLRRLCCVENLVRMIPSLFLHLAEHRPVVCF